MMSLVISNSLAKFLDIKTTILYDVMGTKNLLPTVQLITVYSLLKC